MSIPRRALVVEDTPSARMLVTALLTQQGFDVITAEDGDAGLEAVRTHDPELIVLDLGLPGKDGITACKELRAFSDAYVLMLTAQDSELDKVVGFDAGADDYITKPFSTPEFLARVTALMRRPRRAAAAAATPEPELRRFDNLTVDPTAREATLDGAPLNLTKREFDLLDVLSGQPRVAFTRSQLLERVWGENWFGDDHLVSVHVSNLRRKLGDAGRDLILTVRGIGFRMGPAALIDTIRSRADARPRRLHEILTVYRQDLATRIAELEAAPDRDEIRRHAHGLRSGAATFQATALADAARVVELDPGTPLDDVRAAAAQVDAALASVLAA